MAMVWVFASLRPLTKDKGQVSIAGSNVREIIENMEKEDPGIKDALVYEGNLMPGMAVIVDGETGNVGLLEKVKEDSEVHFLPAIGGGSS